MGKGQIPLEVAEAAKLMGISGGELIERARAGEDVYALVGMEKPQAIGIAREVTPQIEFTEELGEEPERLSLPEEIAKIETMGEENELASFFDMGDFFEIGERPEDIPEHIEEEIPKSYIPKHLTAGYNEGNEPRARNNGELRLPRKTKYIERDLREMETDYGIRKRPTKSDSKIADEYYLGRKIDSSDLGVAI